MITAIFEQPMVQQLSPSMTKTKFGDLPLIIVKHSFCQAIISLQGAQLLSWTPINEKRPIIWLSEKATFIEGKAIRGGIPICWPWFGSTFKPSHGFARTQEWTLLTVEENSEGVILQFGLQDAEKTKTIWPHTFSAITTIKLGYTCYIELACLGQVPSTAALHSYFNVADIRTVSVSGLGRNYQESGIPKRLPYDQDVQKFAGTIDRIYTKPEAISYLHDIDRVIKISHHDASDVVIWNPWQNGANTIEDMADSGYRNMVCIETARINKPLLSAESSASKLAVTIETI